MRNLGNTESLHQTHILSYPRGFFSSSSVALTTTKVKSFNDAGSHWMQKCHKRHVALDVTSSSLIQMPFTPIKTTPFTSHLPRSLLHHLPWFHSKSSLPLLCWFFFWSSKPTFHAIESPLRIILLHVNVCFTCLTLWYKILTNIIYTVITKTVICLFFILTMAFLLEMNWIFSSFFDRHPFHSTSRLVWTSPMVNMGTGRKLLLLM